MWIDDFKQLLAKDTYFIADEFFNTYPIHKFQVKFTKKKAIYNIFLKYSKENNTRLERSND
jgi:hypothetical protein